jgi:phosphoribosylformimino-5-aminoimidazole carboxamide ribotide isomerase
MQIYPAMDLRGGRLVRLDQGDYARETRYDDDPVALACAYAASGATWLHVVDLDAARLGHFMNFDRIVEIVQASGLRVQCGGGVRNEARIEAMLAAGVARVVIGSVAVKQPALVRTWLERYGAERLCIALDTRADEAGVYGLPVAGWTESTAASLHDALADFRTHGVLKHLLCTDIACDGMMSGPNFPLYEDLLARFPGLGLQVSGGVRDLDDVRRARAIGAAGVIVGKALLARRMRVDELLTC